MKLLMLNWRDLANPKSGGAEVLTEGILEKLAAQGWEIILFSAEFPGSKLKEHKNGYTIVRKGHFWSVHFWAFVYWFKQFRHQQFDIVVDQIHGPPFFAALYIRNVPVVAFIHEVAKEIWFSMYRPPLSWIGYTLELIYLRLYRNTSFITVSPSTEQDLIDGGIPKSRISIIPEAINQPGEVDRPKKISKPTVIYIGRLAAMKRVEELIEAVGIAHQKIPSLQLWLIGSGDTSYVNSLKTKATALQLPITFFGRVSEEEKYSLLSRAWLLSSTSLKEGFGLVIIEAATMGTPSVVYRVPGFRDAVIDGQTGILCSPTAQSLADHLADIITNKALYQSLAQNARKYSAQFTFDNAATVFGDTIKRLLKN